MELGELRAFLAVADNGSFSAAAKQLYLTQPAVSKRLAALEEELAIKLFDRIGRQVRLTHAGEVLLPKAREILLQTQDMKHLASNLQSEISGVLALGTSHHIGLHRLPAVLKNFRSRFPQVNLDIRFMDSEAACSCVEKGGLEMAIVTLPTESLPQLQTRELWRDKLLFVASPEHELAKKPSVTLKMLSHYPAVLPGPTTYTRGILDRAAQEYDLEITLGMHTNYMETLKMLSEINLGWSLLPKTMLGNADLVVLPVNLHLSRSLGLVTHSGRTLSNPARALISCLP
ncbi:MAG TPA: LysR family transcriptional regulator [Thiolapillus brandeum]|uniref:LysR family transcriptional regulator n=1 Tax=Thiolapillus brandeum TaxID=1076588 RepID=A0A831KBV0_9GAMM|nr:LysR family transcriptional regulator [Thiolapillus brandeum]